MTATPYYLRPEDTELPEGHDDSLDPPEPPTNPAERGIAPLLWPPVDQSRGATDPPDAPLAPPATDPAWRSVPASTWPTGRPRTTQNRPLRELAVPVPDLDPDIAMWPQNIVSRWPFTGPPVTGIWPLGWIGIDNTATVYICTVGGQPGTWQPLATPIVAGTVLASASITTPTYITASASLVCVDPVNAVLSFTAPPSGRVLLTEASTFECNASTFVIGLRWSIGTVNNANLIGTFYTPGTATSGSNLYATVQHVISGPFIPGTHYTVALQYSSPSSNGTTPQVSIAGGGLVDLVLMAVAL
jgi:hypothetical protein